MTTRKPPLTSVASTGAEVVVLPTKPADEPPPPSPEEVEEARVRAEQRDLNGWVNWLARPEKKVAIVGFTNSRNLAPWGQEGWDLWICNNLYKFCPDSWHRIYDLHRHDEIIKDKEHAAFLTTCKKPVVVMQPREEWPASVAFPKDAIVDSFGRYFSNSISWMIAHAVYEGATEIHVYGVDMAQGTEYAAQRPSCEYFLGLAAGRGIKVYVPPQSDLLKVSAMYGVEDDSALRIKLDERAKELDERLGQLQQQSVQINNQMHQIMGAKENTAYFRGVWVNAAASRDGSPKVESNGDGKPAEAPAEVGA